MRQKKVQKITQLVKKQLRLTFRDPRFLESALMHPSYRNETPRRQELFDFDRLEFFGDAILNYVVCRQLYRKFPEADEGDLSRMRSTLVSRKVLARIAREIRLQHLVRLGKFVQAQPLPHKEKILADSLEALFAAVYLDKGLEQAERFIAKLTKPYLNPTRLLRLNPNPKSALQEISQRIWQKLPAYSSREMKEGVQVVVQIGSQRKAVALGRTKRHAEEKAARLLVQKIRQELVTSKKGSAGK